jgi:hypothetical protein
MSKILTVSDAFWAELQALVTGGGTTITPPPVVVPPPSVPPGVKVMEMPFRSTVGAGFYILIPAGVTGAVKITPPADYKSGDRWYCQFAQSPNAVSVDGHDNYYKRICKVSNFPGDLMGAIGSNTDSRYNFTIGSRVIKPARASYLPAVEDTTTPMFEPGKPIYFNIKQEDPTMSCRVDFQIIIPT